MTNIENYTKITRLETVHSLEGYSKWVTENNNAQAQALKALEAARIGGVK